MLCYIPKSFSCVCFRFRPPLEAFASATTSSINLPTRNFGMKEDFTQYTIVMFIIQIVGISNSGWGRELLRSIELLHFLATQHKTISSRSRLASSLTHKRTNTIGIARKYTHDPRTAVHSPSCSMYKPANGLWFLLLAYIFLKIPQYLQQSLTSGAGDRA